MRGALRLAAVSAAAGLALAAAGTARAAVGEGAPAGLYAHGQALPVVSSAIDVKVSGPFAEATVVQRFRNPLAQATEAVYVFPLPDDASVSSMVIRVGDRRIVARVEAREAARRRYEAAVAAGVHGALLEQERPDVFTQAVTAIPAGGEVTVELSWDASVTRRGGVWGLAVPLVVGPRVVPGRATGAPTRGTGWSADTDRVPDASRVTPEARGDGVPTSVRLHLDATGAIDRLDVPSHDADIKIHGSSADVSVAAPHGDRDLIVRWRTTGDRPAAMTDAAGFVALVVPAGPAAKAPPTDWIVVADTSKSLTGDGIILVRRAVRALADRTRARDRIAVLDGAGHQVVALGGAASARKARTWIDRARPDGAADLAAAMTAARAAAHGPRAAIVLVSDGLVADDAEVLAAVAGGAPVFAIGVGAAPNRGLLDRLAARAGGATRYLTATDDAGQVAAAVAALHAGAGKPAPIDWGGLAVDPVPAVLPPMAPGDAAVVLARVDAPAAARLQVDARALDLPASWTAAAPRPDGIAPVGLLARRWARAKVAALVEAGAPPAQIRALGLSYGLVTPETAMVAVGERAVVHGGVTTSVAVPVAMPAGMRWQAVFGPDGEQAEIEHEGRYRTVDRTVENAGGGAGGTSGKQAEHTGRVTVTTAPAGGTAATPSTGATAPAAPGRGDEGGADEEDLRQVDLEPAARTESAGETIALRGARWHASITLGAGGLVAPERAALATVSTRLTRRLTPRLGAGLDLTMLAAPHADDRVAVAVLGALIRGVGRGPLAVELGVGPEIAKDSGLGYAIGLHFGRRVGLALRWDGAVLFGDGGAYHRGAASVGVELSW